MDFFFRSERVLYFFYPEIVYNRQNWVLGGTENFVIPLKEMYNDFHIALIRSTFFFNLLSIWTFFHSFNVRWGVLFALAIKTWMSSNEHVPLKTPVIHNGIF